MKRDVIVCGSKKYQNICLNKLVDSFDIIVRNNMLLKDNGYGLKSPTIQVLNTHLYDFYNKQVSLNKWKKVYCKEYGVSEIHVEKFFNFLQDSQKTKIVHYPQNNTDLLKEILKKNNINISVTKQLRCGLSHVVECMSKKTTPVLIGFSIDKDSNKTHSYNNPKIKKTSSYHDTDQEIEIIRQLHKKKLIDASFCFLLDQSKVDFNEEVQISDFCKRLIKEVYKDEDICRY